MPAFAGRLPAGHGPELREECGVFGVYGDPKAALLSYFALLALQHRGQESAGIAVALNGRIVCRKDMGLVGEVFTRSDVGRWSGSLAIGHVRYPTFGSSNLDNAQPLVIRARTGSLALAHNGELVNAAGLRDELEAQGAVFQTSSDSEVIAHLAAQSGCPRLEDALLQALRRARGGYALVVLSEGALFAARDPNGIRPLSIGRLGEAWLVASETCAFDSVGATMFRDVRPGEMVRFGPGPGAFASFEIAGPGRPALCSFEYIYFARPDSDVQGRNVHLVRKELGRRLARDFPVEADVVIGVPDSSVSAAIGYAEQAGLPNEIGLVKNRYIGRTFIQPTQESRELAVQVKLNALRQVVSGQRVVLVDDSIVRGTTSRHIVRLLRHNGAREVHLRIASPPYRCPCFYGIDTSASSELIASTNDVAAICRAVGADSLAYQTLDGLTEAIGCAANELCVACFCGDYPVPVPGTAGPRRPLRREESWAELRPVAGPGGTPEPPAELTYRAAGVDLELADRTVECLKALATSTGRPGAIGGLGGFGGFFDLAEAGYSQPVLVSGTDSVGTKLKVAFATGRHDTVGQDCVAMCVNDILCHGAEPLFFLDYIGIARYDPEVVVELVRGVAEGCRLAGCALVGGETAQLPGIYADGEYDLAGCAVGAVERDALLDGSAVRAGDAIVGLAASGLHSNGFTLARRALLEQAGLGLDDRPAALGGERTLADELLEPTLIYARPVLSALRAGLPVHGMANVTGGGLADNSFRILGPGLRAVLRAGTWTVPPVFGMLASAGIGRAELLRTFNCGLGYLLYVPGADAERAVALLRGAGAVAVRVGRVEAGERGFVLEDAGKLLPGD